MQTVVGTNLLSLTRAMLQIDVKFWNTAAGETAMIAPDGTPAAMGVNVGVDVGCQQRSFARMSKAARSNAATGSTH